jgi:hypothetical protein
MAQAMQAASSIRAGFMVLGVGVAAGVVLAANKRNVG